MQGRHILIFAQGVPRFWGEGLLPKVAISTDLPEDIHIAGLVSPFVSGSIYLQALEWDVPFFQWGVEQGVLDHLKAHWLLVLRWSGQIYCGANFRLIRPHPLLLPLWDELTLWRYVRSRMRTDDREA